MHKILLVEDNEPNRVMLARRLERRGYQVLMAPDGEEGYALARAEKPDLILMDISLPGMNGWQVIELLKAESRTREIPLIVLTAHALIDDRARAIASGCDDYYAKPVDFQRLLEAMNRLLVEKKPA
jgi:two-component system, cell cycle response regulator DivK